MLDTPTLTDLFDRLGTPPGGRQLIRKARIAAPVRDVKSRGGNVITIVASRKMGCDIATESRHIEFPAAIDHEFDPDVLEYYPQPCELKLELFDPARQKVQEIRHTPDFLVIREGDITLEEWKSDQKLTGLAEKYPYRYSRDRNGLWHAPQIEKQILDLGIRYRIHTDATIPRCRVENLLYLADYFRPEAEPCPDGVITRLRSALEEHGALFFTELLEEPYDFTADQLNQAIADHRIVTALDQELLTEPRKFRLYRDRHLRDFTLSHHRICRVPGVDRFAFTIAVGTRFEFEGEELTVEVPGEQTVVCNDPRGKTVRLEREWLVNAHESGQIKIVETPDTPCLHLSRYTTEQYREALRRQSILDSQPANDILSKRTLQRWTTRQHVIRENGGHEILALVPRISARGNRTARLDQCQIDVMDRTINEHWRNSKAISYSACYRKLRDTCLEEDIKAPSYPTLITHIKAQETNRDVRTRFGKRMAYQQNTFVDTLHYDTKVHGSRPLQYVHIDHTQLDIELVSSRNGSNLGKPWLSLAVDAWSRRIVGFYLTYDPPSYCSVMMVVRDMVRRHHRLPEFIVVDNGRDFMSEAFESFLMTMGTHLRFRPAGRPRHGAVLERMFGRLNLDYIHNLDGNTKVMKHVRMVSGSHLPKKLARWTLEPLYYGIQFWATEYYDQLPHPALDEAPRDAFRRGLQQSGARAHVHLQFNQDFLIATCPPADRKGTRQVDGQRGVKVHDLFYWHPEFASPLIAGRHLSVRYDPWDASSVYVRVNSEWLHAICRTLAALGQITHAERKALSAEYAGRFRTPINDARADQRLAEFMQTFTPEGAIATDMERHAENRALYTRLQCTSVTPVTPPDPYLSLNPEKVQAFDAPVEAEAFNRAELLCSQVTWNNLPNLEEF
ncbi:DDE-type integrase/transposase/recombinase [Paraburkholderia sp.]|uniref:Mu transposase C-terminal domain-containing protein n=1 Tax=Paraburkholderia sp. TaxID=1926495 RepID=UPI0025DF6E57|nr:DDE-type integrase/transposase/recombinase [Paraburkholderia sp.]